MGTWGATSFENDSAMDWVADLEESGGFGAVDAALDLVIQGVSGRVDDWEFEAAIAAAEVVAATAGLPAGDLPDEVRVWTERHPDPGADRIARATQVVSTTLDGSVILKLWKASESFGDWNAAMHDLKKRLDTAKSRAGGA